MMSSPEHEQPRRRKVLIVGAGPSGLVALKEMLAAGHEAVAVDASGEFGGVFAPRSNVTYEGLHLTISNMFMAFSDFPPKDARVKYWSKEEYYNYLVDYVNHFELEKHIQFHTRVEHAELDATTKQWQVKMKQTKGNSSSSTVVFDYLIVATGANHHPKVPDIFDGFQGEVMHSAQYHSSQQVKGKRVLVIGTGESASDVARSASETAKSVSVWSRRYPDIAPRFPHDYANDGNMDEHERLAHQEDLSPSDCLESYTTTRMVRNMPMFYIALCAQMNQKIVRWLHGTKTVQALCCGFTDVCWSQDYFSADSAMVPTKSAILLCTLAQGKCEIIIAPSISCGENKTVTFHNPSYRGFEPIQKAGNGNGMDNTTTDLDMEFDVIVACTGYTIRYDWVTSPGIESTSCPRSWFKHCFPPNLGDHVAFLGLARPQQGGIPQCSEILARYIAQLVRPESDIRLPSNYAELAKREGDCERGCYHIQPNFELLMDYQAFMLSVAKMLGVTPVCPSLEESKSFSSWTETVVKHWTFPLWPCFFRTQGVGANPKACQQVLDKFGPYDALSESPLFLLSELICTFVMPLVNMVSYLLNPIFNFGKTTALPRAYQWRMSIAHVMYFNSFTWKDCFQFVPYQFVAGIMIVGHFVRGLVKTMLIDPPRDMVEAFSLVKKMKKVKQL